MVTLINIDYVIVYYYAGLEYVGMAQHHVKELKEKLALPVKEPKVCMYTITCVTSECRRFGACVLYMGYIYLSMCPGR